MAQINISSDPNEEEWVSPDDPYYWDQGQKKFGSEAEAASQWRRTQRVFRENLRDNPGIKNLPSFLLDPSTKWNDPRVTPYFGVDPKTLTYQGQQQAPFSDDPNMGFGKALALTALGFGGIGGALGGFGGAAGAAGAAGGAPVSQIPLLGQAPLAGVPVSANTSWMAPGALSGGASGLAQLASGASTATSAGGLFSDGSEDFEPGSFEAASNMGGGGGIDSVLSSIFGKGGAGAAGGAGGILSLLAKGLDIGTGLYGIKQAGDLKDFASETSRSMDPFGPYRAGYAEQLKRLSENPSTITQTPGWDAGIQAVQRSAAGRGYLNSGNEISALHNFGGNFFNNESARLSRLAGADINPGAAGQLAMQGNMSSTNLLGQALNRISAGIGGLS